MLFVRLSNVVLVGVPSPVSMICPCALSCSVSTGGSQIRRWASSESPFDGSGTHCVVIAAAGFDMNIIR
jgi:hypothetical protein